MADPQDLLTGIPGRFEKARAALGRFMDVGIRTDALISDKRAFDRAIAEREAALVAILRGWLVFAGHPEKAIVVIGNAIQ
jgi:hypothetical protein